VKPSPYIDGILKSLPESPGVYQYFNSDGVIIYVGKAKNLKRRVNSYFNKTLDNYKTRLLVKHIADIKYIVVSNEQDAFLLENNLIKMHQPHYNILLKDGKSYPFVCISKEVFPRVFKTRQVDKAKGEYYGPYSYSNTLDLVLEVIHQLYPIRTCHLSLTEEGIKKNKYKVCLKYHLKHCCGVCENYCSKADYTDYINAARTIIKGDAEEISNQMLEEMKRLSSQLRFEEAQQIKERYLLVEKFRSKTVVCNSGVRDVDVFGYDENGQNAYVSILRIHNGSIVQGQTVEYKKQLDEENDDILSYGIYELRQQLGSDVRDIIVPFAPSWINNQWRLSVPSSGERKKLLDLAMQNVHQYKQDKLKQADKLNPDQRAIRVLASLQKYLALPKLPIWIDCFDNSNIQGTEAVAGCVVFRKASPSKKEYKRFNIKTVQGTDDYASMREIVYRRYARLVEENVGLPDLIIADGGVGQMTAIEEAVVKQLGLNIPIAGLAKDNRHRTSMLLFGNPPQEVDLKITDEVFKLLARIQEEVHRFAISFHKEKRSRQQTKSVLDDIYGVGETTKAALLKRFGSVKRIKEANLSELNQVIGNHKGSIVYEFFHGQISPRE